LLPREEAKIGLPMLNVKRLTLRFSEHRTKLAFALSSVSNLDRRLTLTSKEQISILRIELRSSLLTLDRSAFGRLLPEGRKNVQTISCVPSVASGITERALFSLNCSL
jgi:hypothetical protein